MHGYFVSLKLYETARLIVNPFAYAEHREKMVREKMDKMAETRIRTKKDVGVKVNKALAEKILKDEERALKKKRKTAERKGENAMDVDDPTSQQQKPNLLSDPRFSQVFEDAAFAIDETSREFALLNPSSVAQPRIGKGKTAVEDEEEESDKISSDGLGNSEDDSDDGSESGSDSSDAGGNFFPLCSYFMHSTVSSQSLLNSTDERVLDNKMFVQRKRMTERGSKIGWQMSIWYLCVCKMALGG